MKVDKFVRTVGRSYGITDKDAKRASSARFQKRNPYVGTKGFIGVDGEGINLSNGEHRYVLLGIGNDQIEDENGLQWNDILEFLYAHRQDGYAYVGFYLGYDFDRWLRTMPQNKVAKLLTDEGKKSRISKSDVLHGLVLPVDLGEWQIKMIGKKLFQFRKRTCYCDTYFCEHPKGKWMFICDAGPFFQSSFLKAIDPKSWKEPIVTQYEYDLIKKGKDNRADADCIDDEMRYYNRLENEILARLMNVLNSGFREMGITLGPGQWFGPGQAAQKWMKKEKVPKADQIRTIVPQWFLEAARASYFGGWFEIMMHGHIPGETHEYDINSAYPYIISRLPCLLHGEYERGNGKPDKDTGYVLVRALVSAKEIPRGGTNSIGTMLHRERHDRILRPMRTKGWFWLHELKAAKQAKLITYIRYYEWMSYAPCDCLPPMRNVASLYDLRLKVGKDTPLGKGARLAYNSMYGKFAQSIGHPIFANPVWASLITSGCRTMILEAIATHPKGQDDVCMVATDAVFFVTPHPGLPISKRLGEWDYECRDNLTLFKPGVYWDDNTRQDIHENRMPRFKARGFASADFADSIAEVDRLYAEWNIIPPKVTDNDGIVEGWPNVEFEVGFLMISCLQAIRRGKWWLAGEVQQFTSVEQNANPYLKRIGAWSSVLDDKRTVWRSIPWHMPLDDCESKPYQKRFGMDDPWSLERMEIHGINQEGTSGEIVSDKLGLR
jgi:DNA polymerase type B, organellar and viral